MRCSYDGLPVLRGVDLDLQPGELLVLLGANGAGKTTLLSIASTLRPAEAGSVSLAGHDLRAAPDRVRRSLGFVGHRPLLYPALTARENLVLHARLHGLPAPGRAADDALDALGMSARAEDPLRVLSHGATRRVAIARALLHAPRVLLLDEPYAGLDPTAADVLDRTLRELAARGRGVLLSSHDLLRALDLGDRIAMLDGGRIAWTARAADLDRATLEALWRGGEPAASGDSRRRPAALGSSSTPAARRPAAAPAALPEVGALAATAALAAPAAPLEASASDGDAAAARGPRRPPGLAKAGTILAAKDLRVEWRAREIVPPLLVFSLLVAVLLSYAFPGGPRELAAVAPGAIWVSLLLGSTLGLSRAAALEQEGGALTGLLLTPVDRGALYLGRWLSTWFLGVGVALPVLVAITAFFELPAPALPSLFGLAALGLVGWTAVGVLLSALAASARAREILLPVILYPLVLPLVLPAVKATAAVLGSGPAGDLAPALALMAAYDVVFLVAGFLAFPLVLEGADPV